MVEFFERGPEGEKSKPPLLFVHGAWHGAWCWSLMQDYLSANGVQSFAVNLRGHGSRPADRNLSWVRVKHYVEDVVQAFEKIKKNTGSSPIVVGHSMGGLVVQKFLEGRSDVPKAILLAPVPPQGVWRITLDILFKHPLDFLMVNLTLGLWPLVNTPSKAKRLFFSAAMPDDEVESHFRKLQDESWLGFLDMLVFDLPSPGRVTTPLVVMGAENDVIFPPARVRDTATAYGSEATLFENMAHDMMLDPGWEQVADRIIAEMPEQR